MYHVVIITPGLEPAMDGLDVYLEKPTHPSV